MAKETNIIVAWQEKTQNIFKQFPCIDQSLINTDLKLVKSIRSKFTGFWFLQWPVSGDVFFFINNFVQLFATQERPKDLWKDSLRHN